MVVVVVVEEDSGLWKQKIGGLMVSFLAVDVGTELTI